MLRRLYRLSWQKLVIFSNFSLIQNRYKYVSSFTIKLLKEGFDLGDHFLALRRYHFMETADWADNLVASLFNQVLFLIIYCKPWELSLPQNLVSSQDCGSHII